MPSRKVSGALALSGSGWSLVLIVLLILVVALLQRDRLRQVAAAEPARVEDRAHLLSADQQAGIGAYHAALLETHDIDYRVLTLEDSGNIAWTAHRHFDDNGVGSLSASGRGLLLVIDGAQDRVRLEVSTSLEGVYTDAFVAYVQNRQMVPFFQSGRVADGILATTELIVTRAQQAEAGLAFAPPMSARSMGGGATADAGIDAGGDPAAAFQQRSEQIAVAGLTPEQVVEAYLDAMGRRDARPDLPIYSEETTEMLAGWTVTPAQMDSVARSYQACRTDLVATRAARSVVRYPAEQRQCAPFFLRLEDNLWKLDLTVMSSLIRFNHRNHWRFAVADLGPYRFAFDDWRFDSRGFPLAD